MLRAVVATMMCVAAVPCAFAADDVAAGSAPSAAAKPWAFALTAYPTVVHGGENYTSGIATADRGALHLEARYNYESIGARSAFVGWTFSGGEGFTWEVTPLLGGAWGTTQAFIPGLEATLAWGPVDFYIEAEYVRDNHDNTNSYTYAWSELGSGRSSGCASALPASTPAPTPATVPSSADRSRRSPGVPSQLADTGSIPVRASRFSWA